MTRRQKTNSFSAENECSRPGDAVISSTLTAVTCCGGDGGQCQREAPAADDSQLLDAAFLPLS
jgi:hypothetical protein